MNEKKIKVGGMNCNHCKINVENGLKRISGVDIVIADIVNGEVMIKGKNIDLENVKSTVNGLGYFYDGEIK